MLLEIRDRNTFIPALAINCQPGSNPVGDKLLRACGYSSNGPTILLTRLAGRGSAHADPYEWGDRTMKTAHLYILENWYDLKDGDVIDVEFILGETTVKKEPQS